MKIAIIGAGNVGSAIARATAATGHSVVISAAQPEHAKAAATATGTAAAATNTEAVAGADLVVLAVPYQAVAGIVDELADHLRGTTVIDVTNPLTADFSALATQTRSAAEELQDRLPGAAVVKAFNTAFAANQADPVVEGMPLDGYVAGDDENAKRTVAQLLEAIGFRPIDVGGLSSARALEHMAFLNITLNARNGWPWRSGWKLVGPTGGGPA